MISSNESTVQLFRPPDSPYWNKHAKVWKALVAIRMQELGITTRNINKQDSQSVDMQHK